jgi:putative inorganic carbon (hco3(-)) transporter
MLLSPFIGIVIAISMALIMLIGIKSPFWVAFVYLLMRPILFPYTVAQYTFLGLPLSSLPSLVLLIAAIKFSLFSKTGTLFLKNMNLLYLLLFIMLLSTFNSFDYYRSLHFIIQYITAICLAIIVYNAINKIEDLIFFFKCIAVSAIFPLWYGLYEKFILGHHRISSVLSFNNEYGIYLSFIIVVTLCVILYNRFNWSFIIWYMVFLLSIISFFLSLNRGSWIALSFAFICGAVIFIRYIKIRWYIIFGLIIFFLASTLVIERFQELQETTPWGASKDTFSGRIDYWMELKDIAVEKIYFGWGPGTSRPLSAEKLSIKNVPHNDYLRLTLEIGIIGTIIFVFFLIKNFFSILKRVHHINCWKVNYAMLIIMTYYIVISLPQNIIDNVILFPLFLSILAGYNKLYSIDDCR